ncbi:MAG: LAGLIDADG family homing endonuclease [Bacteroidota bacterium]
MKKGFTVTPFSFSRFYKIFKDLYPDKPVPKPSFLEWFIGFSEGDGCFMVNSRGSPVFIVTQSTKDIQVLWYIKENLGFGRVNKQGGSTHRFVVDGKFQIILIVYLFNGNLVFPKRVHTFSAFLKATNKKFKSSLRKPIQIIFREVYPTKNDLWFCGLTDAEGCFTCSLLGNSTAYRFRFILAQKGEENKKILEYFTQLFQGQVSPHHNPNTYTFTVNGIRNSREILTYFGHSQLRTKKSTSFWIWKNLSKDIRKGEHLNKKARKYLKFRSRLINK